MHTQHHESGPAEHSASFHQLVTQLLHHARRLVDEAEDPACISPHQCADEVLRGASQWLPTRMREAIRLQLVQYVDDRAAQLSGEE
jgi:hypothetical protein